jgi:hypothetical protein
VGLASQQLGYGPAEHGRRRFEKKLRGGELADGDPSPKLRTHVSDLIRAIKRAQTLARICLPHVLPPLQHRSQAALNELRTHDRKSRG